MSENATTQTDREALRAELELARAKLDGLSAELREVDGVLEELSTERQQYALVREACGALEKLGELGGAELFWGDRASGGNGDYHVGAALRRVEEFEGRLREIEGTRDSLLERIRGAQDDADYIEDDVLEAEQEEELRKLEWVVERELGPLPELDSTMPWSRGGEDDERFRKSLLLALLISLVFAVLFPLIPLPEAERWEVIEVSERFTSLIREEEPPPPVLQREPIPEELKPEVSEEEPVVAEESTPEPEPVPVPKESAGAKGILAFREKFSSLADSKPSAKLGAQARISRSGEAAAGRQGRSLVTSQTPGSSGGIDIASISRDSVGGGGQAIEGVQVGQATSSIGGVAGPDRPLSGGPGPGRTDEEIQIVFDRHKAALYRLYNRELRRDPTLQGQIVLRLTIEPDGSVSLCEVHSSDMKAPELAAQVAGRVRTFDFGAKEGIPSITILYPIDFLPAT